MKNKKFLGLIFIFALAMILSACSLQKDKNIVSIEIVNTTVPEQIVVGEFDNAHIQAKVTYDDNTYETINITSSLLGDENQNLITKPGTYEIEIFFRGVSTTITINMVAATEQFTVKFFNGRNEIVSVQVVEEGQNAVAPNPSTCQIEGYNFIGWDRTFTNITENINVYGIYVKVTNTQTADYSSILYEGIENMMKSTLNISQIFEAPIRYDTTMYYKNSSYDKLVIKRTDDGAFTHYELFEKTISNNTVNYTRKYYTVNGEMTNAIEDYYFNQYDVYAKFKRILTSATSLTYSKTSTPTRQVYSLVAVLPNTEGETTNGNRQYEILFDSTQIISVKEYIVTNNADKPLSGTTYYTVNPTKDELVLYPTEVSLINAAGDVFNNDVIVTKKEMRDYLCITERVTNDASNKAVKVDKGNNNVTYVWCDYGDNNMLVTYYTKESLNSEVLPTVYKSNGSEKEYGTEYYYLVKNTPGTATVSLNDNGDVLFTYNVAESSLNPAYTIRFTVANGKLVNVTKYVGSAIHYELTFEYTATEVSVPQALINAQANAIIESN